MPSPLVNKRYQALLPSEVVEGHYDFDALEARVAAIEATPTTVPDREKAATNAAEFMAWWLKECRDRLPQFVFPDPLFERILSAYYARGFLDQTLDLMLARYSIVSRSRAFKDATALVEKLSGDVQHVRALRNAVQARRDEERISEAEAREECRPLNQQLDRAQQSLDEADALLGRTAALCESSLLPADGPVVLCRCAYMPDWPLLERGEDAGEHEWW